MSDGKAKIRNAAKQDRWERNTRRSIKKYLLGVNNENQTSSSNRFNDLIRMIRSGNVTNYGFHSGVGMRIKALCTKHGISISMLGASKCVPSGPYVYIHEPNQAFLKFLDLVGIVWVKEMGKICIFVMQDIEPKVFKYKRDNIPTQKEVLEQVEPVQQPVSEFELLKAHIDSLNIKKKEAERNLMNLNSNLIDAKRQMHNLVKDYI